MQKLWALLTGLFQAPPDDATPCMTQANSYREVVSLQAVFVTLTVALLAYVHSSPEFQVRVDVMFVLLATVPILGLYQIVRGRTRTAEGVIYVCTRPIRSYAKQSMILNIVIVVLVSLLYWQRQLPGQ